MDVHVLNTEQIKVMNLAMSGHNVFLGGKSGTGKTYTVKRIVDILKQTKRVQITCTTGMACSLYDDAMTLHSFAGIQNSRMNVDALVTSVLSRDSCKRRWIETEVLIIDEVSQLSAKNLELINILAQRSRGCTKLFGGMQVIFVGDFFQLPPIESDVDKGNYCFESVLWDPVFGHSVVLEKVYRQDRKEKQFLSLLDEFALGECSDNSLKFLKGELCNKQLHCQDFGIPFVPHIFCNNFDAKFYNMNKLDKLPGESKLYVSVDSCKENILNKVTIAERNLILKVRAEVMLIYNISSKLTNGTRGTVVKLEDDGPTINFYKVGITCKLTRASWFAYKPGTTQTVHVIGQPDQFPVKLAWGITAHKSQGQTLEAAYVHSGKEFVAGQLYVSASRVSSHRGISILGFNAARLITADSRVVNFYNRVGSRQPLDDYQCCRNVTIDIEVTGGDFQYLEYPMEDEISIEEDFAEIDAICESYFIAQEDNEDDHLPMINLEDVLEEALSCDEEIHSPANLCVHSFLERLKDSSAQSLVEGSLGSKINELTTSLQQPSILPTVKTFIDIQWVRLAQSMKENIKKKRDGTTTYDFRGIMTDEFNILNTKHLANEFAAVLGNTEIDVEHQCLMTEIVKAIRVAIISTTYLARCVENEDEDEQQGMNVWDMSDEGKGKVRYVGGWAIVKLIYGHKRYITQYLASNNPHVRNELHQRYTYVNILESLVAQSSNIHMSTSYEGTLSVTDMKQYRQNCLVHISDKAFQFFMNLEQSRIKTLCHKKFNVLKQELLPMSIASVKNDQRLKDQWLGVLDDGVEGTEEQKLVLFESTIEKFFKMGAGQYIRDFRRDHNVSKTEAHRKRVQDKKFVKERVADKIMLKSIKDDMSDQKQASHNMLVALVTKRPNIFETSSYTKQEIKVLYEAYGERFVTSWNKAKLNTTLVQCIMSVGRIKNADAFDNC